MSMFIRDLSPTASQLEGERIPAGVRYCLKRFSLRGCAIAIAAASLSGSLFLAVLQQLYPHGSRTFI